MDVKADESSGTERNAPDIGVVNPFVYSPGNRTYNTIGRSLGLAHTRRGKYSDY
jgi:hypothetical protein